MQSRLGVGIGEKCDGSFGGGGIQAGLKLRAGCAVLGYCGDVSIQKLAACLPPIGVFLALAGGGYLSVAFDSQTLKVLRERWHAADKHDLLVGFLLLFLGLVAWWTASKITYDYEGICREQIEKWHRALANSDDRSRAEIHGKIDVELALAELKIKVRQADHAPLLTWLAPFLPFLGAIIGALIGGMFKPRG